VRHAVTSESTPMPPGESPARVLAGRRRAAVPQAAAMRTIMAE
jgi:hypothetical protein